MMLKLSPEQAYIAWAAGGEPPVDQSLRPDTVWHLSFGRLYHTRPGGLRFKYSLEITDDLDYVMAMLAYSKDPVEWPKNA